jgi:serine/threonine protein kinase
MDSRGDPRLIDFGLSVAVSTQKLWRATSSLIGGNLRYMAPEYMQNNDAYPSATTQGDIYAFSMTSFVSHIQAYGLIGCSVNPGSCGG